MRVDVGTDLIEVERIQEAMLRHPEGFGKRVFTAVENAYCGKKKNAYVHFAGRFAAKEAVLKALGIGLRGGVGWTDLEIVNDAMGKPLVTLSGKALEISKQKGTVQLEISITHCKNFANAVAVLVRNPPPTPPSPARGEGERL